MVPYRFNEIADVLLAVANQQARGDEGIEIFAARNQTPETAQLYCRWLDNSRKATSVTAAAWRLVLALAPLEDQIRDLISQHIETQKEGSA